MLSKGGKQDVPIHCFSLAEKESWFRKPIAFSEVLVDWSNQCVTSDCECVRICDVNGKVVSLAHACHHQRNDFS